MTTEPKSKIVNCYIEHRRDQADAIFIVQPDGSIMANLVGYAIIPIEVYDKLIRPNFISRAVSLIRRLVRA